MLVLEFFTVLFLIISVIHLVKGTNFTQFMLHETLKTAVKDKDTMNEDEQDITVKTSAVIIAIGFFIALFYEVIDVIYYLVAFHYDIYKYPTIAMLLLLIISIVYSVFKSSKNATTNNKELSIKQVEDVTKSLEKKFSFKDTLERLINVAYYGYMIYILFMIY